jgi:cell division initiation protein
MLTPVEIRHVKPGRRAIGYDRHAVDRLFVQIAESYEDVWRERADLRDHIERLEAELARYKELDGLLRTTLLSAERMADEARGQARREAELIVEEARVRAREVAAEAETERERVRAEVRRLRSIESEMRAGYRAFLLTALDRLDTETADRNAPDQAA